MVVGMSNEFDTFAQRAKIKVCGVGGGGSNAVNRMIAAGLRDVDFIVINTDAQALKHSPAPRRLQIGLEVTSGLGSGGKPETGQQAALEDRERLSEILGEADMVFLTAGLGGGTGTGAAPVCAEIARATGALTLGIVTLPFSFEGPTRTENALKGLAALQEQVNSLIVIPNDRVASLGENDVTFLNAFEQADEVLHNGVRAITQLIQVHGLWNVDFADFRTVMEGGGRALMGIGQAEGEGRAGRAAQEAIICPLLQQRDITGATGVIVNVRGGRDIGMREIEEAMEVLRKSAHPDATYFVGAALDEDEKPELEVTVIAAGFAGTSCPELETAAPTAEAELPVTDVDTVPPPPQVETRESDWQDDFPAPEAQQPQPVRELPATGPGFQTEFPEDAPPGDRQPTGQPVVLEPAAATVSGGSGNGEDDDIGIPTWLRVRRKK